jgi:hypothetical protein
VPEGDYRFFTTALFLTGATTGSQQTGYKKGEKTMDKTVHQHNFICSPAGVN